MKIKNNQGDLSERPQTCKHIVSNKQNIPASECKKEHKVITRSKSTFGDDITKKMNEPPNQRNRFINKSHRDIIKLPQFLIKATAFNSEIAPYEESIIEYIIQTHEQYDFPLAFKKKLKNKKNKRMFVIQKIYKLARTYKLKRTTLFLSIYYFDKYIKLTNQKDVSRHDLIAQAALLIAMKYQEIYPPLLSRWAKGREKIIVQQQSKMLKAMDFKLAYTSPQHYLQIYLGKNTNITQQQKRLYQLILDLYLFTGYIYDEHPLKTAQEVVQSFRSTSFMEKDTNYHQSDTKVKSIIQENSSIWDFLIKMEIYTKKK